MKTITAFAVTLAASMALAPMAANAATIVFDSGSGGRVTYGGGDEALSGLLSLNPIRGQDTPRNAGESGLCGSQCVASFQTGAHLSTRDYFEVTEPNPWSGGGPGYILGDDYEWKGGGFLEITNQDSTWPTVTTLLTGTFVEPVTASTRTSPPNHPGLLGDLNMVGVLKDVVIDEDLAAYYGVPNQGTGEIKIRASNEYGALLGRRFQFETDVHGTVTFSPVPVPAALPLMLTALAGLGLIRLRRMQAGG